MRRPKATFSSAFWKNTTRSRPARVMGTPSSLRSPCVGVSKPARMFSSVVLPQPLAPRRQNSSPLPMSRSMPARTRAGMAPRRRTNDLSRRRIASIAGATALPAELRRHALGQRAQERARLEEGLRVPGPLQEPDLLHPDGELVEVVPGDLVEPDHALVVRVIGLDRRGVLHAELRSEEHTSELQSR